MTREDAAKHFESYIGNECYTDFHQDACQMAIAVLRSQQTPAKLDRSRWKGCEWCREFGAVPLRGFTVHGCTSTTAHFCPNCGKPLTEVAEYQHLCETYVEAGLDSKFVQVCIDATKRGVTIEQIMELGSSNDPLTLDELREMGGEPVWCLEMRCWGIIKLETIGQWARMPFLIGTLHDRGVAVDFEYDVVKRELTLYRRRSEEG